MCSRVGRVSRRRNPTARTCRITLRSSDLLQLIVNRASGTVQTAFHIPTGLGLTLGPVSHLALPAMLYPFLRRFLFSLDPEHAHRLALQALHWVQAAPLQPSPPSDPRLSQEVWGVRFPNPVGLAAGYDKNAEVPLAWPALGFGFAELGTLTAQAQPGNPKPRIFRLEKDRACINRLGFNNDGAAAAARRLGRLLTGRQCPIPLGFNIGKSRTTPLEDAVNDYLESSALLLPFADYLVVNVSSPNTPELRKLQEVERLAKLLEALITQASPTRPTDRHRPQTDCGQNCARPEPSRDSGDCQAGA